MAKTIIVSSVEGNKAIEVEFEGGIYEGIFSVIPLETYGKYRGQVRYRDYMPITFGTYNESDDIETAAKKELVTFISGLPHGERVSKRKG
jgi:hypothetical protein